MGQLELQCNVSVRSVVGGSEESFNVDAGAVGAVGPHKLQL